jgi:hypothetical protein
MTSILELGTTYNFGLELKITSSLELKTTYNFGLELKITSILELKTTSFWIETQNNLYL